MRIALLTALAEDPDRGGQKLAFRSFAGRSVLSHQIDCARELGCEAVVCMVRGLGPEAIACQHRAESSGMRFQAVEDLRRLSGLVKADDRVVVMADGLNPDPEIAVDVIGERAVVATFPADVAVPRGFERIDSERAWAGVLSVRGDTVERLSDLPPDSDAASALLRLALQTGVRTHPLDPALLDVGGWDKSGDPETLRASEARWIARRAAPAPFSAPGRAVAERIGIRLARDLVGSRFGRAPILVATGAGVLAAMLGVVGKPLTALAISGLMMLAIPVARIVLKLGRAPRREESKWHAGSALDWASDALLVGLLALAGRTTESWIDLFLPAVLIALLRIATTYGMAGLRPLFSDRIALLALLIPASYLGFLQPLIAIVSLVALAALFRAIHTDRLTTP